MADINSNANHAPVGLLGFALTTFLLNLHNIGLFGNSSMIIGMGIFFGGLAQLFAGILVFKQGRNFGGVAFMSYGSFWLALCAIWMLPKMGLADAPNHLAMGFFLLAWGIFTFGMFLGTLKLNAISKLVFGTLTALFALLAVENFAAFLNMQDAANALKVFAGLTGVVCASFAFYDAMAQILQPLYGRKFPLM